jgi:hypothetical protein
MVMRSKLINTVSHLAGWILFFSLILAFLSGPPGGSDNVWKKIFSWPFLIFSFTFLSLFYLNYFVLVPFLFLRKKYIPYFAIIVTLFALVYIPKPFDRLIAMNPPPERRQQMPNNPPSAGNQDRNNFDPKRRRGPGNRDINSIILFVTIWSISTGIPLMRQWRQSERRLSQAEAERAQAELSFLKAQVNPHFLFNTLNNIYSMAVTKHENIAPSIMKLSNIMRYVTDEASQDFVPLEDEVSCMNDYIDLQKMRMGDKMNVEVSVTGSFAGKQIAPLLLMTFVENVFKYGTSNHEPSSISISLKADEHNILFSTRNKLFEQKRSVERTGIGIANARKRLGHLYPARYILDINSENGLFIVNLVLGV